MDDFTYLYVDYYGDHDSRDPAFEQTGILTVNHASVIPVNDPATEISANGGDTWKLYGIVPNKDGTDLSGKAPFQLVYRNSALDRPSVKAENDLCN